jgi:3-hydroxymyristoyl/3-hydroxydecanoyl-(acyl carrier protein) dehydratase
VSEIYCEYKISRNHPCLAGHFPNNAIVPGVVILDYTRVLLEKSYHNRRIKTLANVKFIRPLYPEQPFSIYLKTIAKNKIKFYCLSEGEKIIYGIFITERQL